MAYAYRNQACIKACQCLRSTVCHTPGILQTWYISAAFRWSGSFPVSHPACSLLRFACIILALRSYSSPPGTPPPCDTPIIF